MAGKNWDKKTILLKTEVTEGTDPTPTVGSNALRVLNYKPIFMDADQKVRKIDKAYFGADPVVLAAFKRGATFDMEWHGGGTATTKPQWMVAAALSGFDLGVAGGSNVVQTPTSVVGSATHYAYIDDLLMPTVGARASMGFTFEDDEIPIFNFSLLGRPPTTLATESTPGAITLAGVNTPILASTENSTFTLDGFALPLRRWTMNANADLQLRSLIGPADYIAYRNRNWNGQIVCELPSLATKNYFTGIRPGTTMVATAVHGNVAGNIVQASCPVIQITGNVDLTEEQGKLMATFPVTALPNAGNDEIVFTTS